MTNKISHFEYILKKFDTFPLWVKQAVLTKMLSSLSTEVTLNNFIHVNAGNVLGLYVPKITSTGISILKNNDTQDFDPALYKILKSIYSNKTLIDICNDHGLTLSESARYICQAIDQSFVAASASPHIMYSLFYLAGRIQLEHYLYRIGKINQHQLKQVMYAKKQSEEAFGDDITIKDIIENLGLIGDDDKVLISMLEDAANSKVHIVDESLESMQETMKKLSELEFVESKYQALLEDNGFLRKEIADQVNEIMALKRQLRQLVGGKKFAQIQQNFQADNA